LLLAYDWWEKIPPYLENPKVAAASGMRFTDKPKGVRKRAHVKYFISKW
jgi:hypothetical protein